MPLVRRPPLVEDYFITMAPVAQSLLIFFLFFSHQFHFIHSSVQYYLSTPELTMTVLSNPEHVTMEDLVLPPRGRCQQPTPSDLSCFPTQAATHMMRPLTPERRVLTVNDLFDTPSSIELSENDSAVSLTNFSDLLERDQSPDSAISTRSASRQNEVIDYSTPLRPKPLVQNKSARKAKNTSRAYDGRLRSYSLDIHIAEFSSMLSRIREHAYPDIIFSEKHSRLLKHSKLKIHVIPCTEQDFCKGLTFENLGCHAAYAKALTDLDCHLPEKAQKLEAYESIRNMTHLYRVFIPLTPANQFIRPEWIAEALESHGKRRQAKITKGEKVTERGRLNLTVEKAQELWDKLLDVNGSECGHVLDVLITALYSCKVKIPANHHGEEVADFEIGRPQNMFFVFARSFEDSVSKGENLRQPELRAYTSVIWKRVLTEVQREVFRIMGDEMDQIHRIVHPTYKYNPRRSTVDVEEFDSSDQTSPGVCNSSRRSSTESRSRRSSTESSQKPSFKRKQADTNADSAASNAKRLRPRSDLVDCEIADSSSAQPSDHIYSPIPQIYESQLVSTLEAIVPSVTDKFETFFSPNFIIVEGTQSVRETAEPTQEGQDTESDILEVDSINDTLFDQILTRPWPESMNEFLSSPSICSDQAATPDYISQQQVFDTDLLELQAQTQLQLPSELTQLEFQHFFTVDNFELNFPEFDDLPPSLELNMNMQATFSGLGLDPSNDVIAFAEYLVNQPTTMQPTAINTPISDDLMTKYKLISSSTLGTCTQ
ncbi:uncharacterized protein V2V93DRAFT_362020 [Kockiozyma suomiensis]|uniref:uncharacterized protein n=1 Tax=Kockiozyma suomiensis TaxID=1337062 RepID=UPI003343A18F